MKCFVFNMGEVQSRVPVPAVFLSTQESRSCSLSWEGLSQYVGFRIVAGQNRWLSWTAGYKTPIVS